MESKRRTALWLADMLSLVCGHGQKENRVGPVFGHRAHGVSGSYKSLKASGEWDIHGYR